VPLEVPDTRSPYVGLSIGMTSGPVSDLLVEVRTTPRSPLLRVANLERSELFQPPVERRV
jgi:hypothetical protein